MHPLHIKNQPDNYELALQGGDSWKKPLFVLLGGFLVVTAVTLLLALSFTELLAGVSTFISLCVDVLAIVLLFAGERTQGRLFFVESILLVLILLLVPWIWGLGPPLLWLGGSTLIFIVLFIFTYIGASNSDRQTRKSIGKFSISLSENAVTVGTPFTLNFQLFFKQAIPMKDLLITFSYQEYTGRESYGEDAYATRSLPVYQKAGFTGDPADPIIEELQWTVPESLNTLGRERLDWSLEVSIEPEKGSKLHGSYSLRVLPILSASDEEQQPFSAEEQQPASSGEWHPASDEEWQSVSDEEWPATSAEEQQPFSAEEQQTTSDEEEEQQPFSAEEQQPFSDEEEEQRPFSAEELHKSRSE